jgi:subtilisin family serine protease
VKVSQLVPIRAITADWAWGGSSGEGVKVAVVDTGVDATHPAVGPIQGYIAFREGNDGELVCDTEPHEDAAGHGTACAGVIRELAPACELYSVKVLGSSVTGLADVFEAGLRWVIHNGIQVCNLSLGSKKREQFAVIHELTDIAYFNNVVLVTAAPNEYFASYPSLYSSVVSVASHDVPDQYTYYYNPDPPVEFGAHGIDVRLAWRGHKYLTATGNSFAAPHIAGLAAKILGKHPGLTIFQLKTILHELANNVGRSADPSQSHPIGQRQPRNGGRR